jgi:hypothetical protein
MANNGNPRISTTQIQLSMQHSAQKIEALTHEDILYRRRIEGFVSVPPEEYLQVLNDLDYQRKLAQLQHKQLKDEYLQRKRSAKKHNIVRSNPPTAHSDFHRCIAKNCCEELSACGKGKRIPGYKLLRACGFLSQGFAFTCFRFANLILFTFSIIGLASEGFQRAQLQKAFPTDKSMQSVRSFSLWGLCCLLVASMLGLLTDLLGNGKILIPYAILWVLGWSLFFYDMENERRLAFGEDLEEQMNLEIQEFVNSPGSELGNFMASAQLTFQCCGTLGPEGYGYRKTALKLDEKFIFPLSCCRVKSYRFLLRGLKECTFTKSRDETISLAHPNSFLNKDGCYEPVQKFLRTLFWKKVLVHWMAFLALGWSLIPTVVYTKIFFTNRKNVKHSPYVKPHQNRRLSAINEIIKSVQENSADFRDFVELDGGKLNQT